MRTRISTIALIACFLSGCNAQSGNQLAVETAQSEMSKAGPNFLACRLAIREKPKYASIIPYLPVDGDYSISILSNKNLLSLKEAKLLAEIYDENAPCRRDFLATMRLYRGDLANAYNNAFNQSANITVELVQRRISIGEGAKRAQEMNRQTSQYILVLNQKYMSDMQASQQAEMAQRRANAAIMMGFMQNQQALNQQQMMIQQQANQQQLNAIQINRPVFNQPSYTNCNAYGSMINCVTR